MFTMLTDRGKRGSIGRLHKKKKKIEVRDRRLRLHRLALPSPAEIISTRANGMSLAASHGGYANGTRGRGTVVSQLRWQSKHAYTIENGFIDHQRKTDSLVSAFLFCIRSARLRILPFATRKYIRQMLKSKQAQVLPSLKTEENRKCNLQVARMQIAESLFVSTWQFWCCDRTALKNYAIFSRVKIL